MCLCFDGQHGEGHVHTRIVRHIRERHDARAGRILIVTMQRADQVPDLVVLALGIEVFCICVQSDFVG